MKSISTVDGMAHYLLDSTNFPLYSVNSFGKGYFLVAGGGGVSKTGIPNAVNVYQIGCEGGKLNATLLEHFNPGPEAVMNVAVHPSEEFCFAAGMDDKCQLVSCDVKQTKATKQTGDDKPANNEASSPEVSMAVGKCQVTTGGKDEKNSEHYQKCVCFTSDGKHLITGASDGHVKVLKYPSLELIHEIKAHSGDVDDIAVHPNSKTFVSVSRDATAFTWKLHSGTKDFQLFFTGDQEKEHFYKIRNVRFVEERRSKECYMYTTHTPTKMKGKNVNFIVKWDTHKWVPIKSVEMVKYAPSQLAVSPCGTYVGVGCADGSVQIYSSWNMNLLQTVPDVHGIFVTGLAFLPNSKLTYEILKMDAALLSISVDNNVQLTVLPRRADYGYSVAITGFVFAIVLIFYLIAMYDINF